MPPTTESISSGSSPSLSESSRARDTLVAAHGALPTDAEVQALLTILTPEVERGYLRPESDDMLRVMFARYLHTRGSLIELLASSRRRLPVFRRNLKPEELQAFVAGWLAGCMLMRTSRYLVVHFQNQPLIPHLLNQAYPPLGIPARMFDEIRDTSTATRTLFQYFWSLQVADAHQEAIAALADDPEIGALIPLLEAEQPFLERQKRTHADAFAKARIARIRNRPSRHLRALSWEIFEHSGRMISRCRNPFHRKRVKRPVMRHMRALLQPGDILVTRHDDALSNLFLPGFWPHAALCIGSPEQRRDLQATLSPEHERQAGLLPAFMEARIDGVRIRRLSDTLSVDAFVVIRPNGLTDDQRAEMVRRAETHEGKLYDFEFDFSRADRLVCTEVIYRSMDGIGGVTFDLLRKAGRFTLPTETLIRQTLIHPGFEVLALYGLHGNHWVEGPHARDLLERSLQTA